MQMAGIQKPQNKMEEISTVMLVMQMYVTIFTLPIKRQKLTNQIFKQCSCRYKRMHSKVTEQDRNKKMLTK